MDGRAVIVGSSSKIKHTLEASDMLRKNVSASKIHLALSQEGYYQSQRDKIIQHARAILENEATKSLAEHYQQSLASLEDLYTKNYAIQDYRECRAIMSDRNKLFLMYQNALEDASG